MPVRTFLLPPGAPSPAALALLRAADGKGAVPASAGQSVVLDGVELRVLQAADEAGAKRGEASTVVLVSYGGHSFLITGDLGAAEEKMAAGRLPGPGSVLKVSHHGARTATTPELLAALRPQYAVISVGYNNRFGHPHPDALARLAAAGATVLRTDRDGAVVFRSDGERLTVETYRH